MNILFFTDQIKKKKGKTVFYNIIGIKGIIFLSISEHEKCGNINVNLYICYSE